jgi:hypothetical protein
MACRCCESGTPCEINEDCSYYLVTVAGFESPLCPAEYLHAYFDNAEDAFAFASPLAADSENCLTVSVDNAYGRCCDNECYPRYDSLPFFSNLEPGEDPCP